jgi:hypothetical protein
LSVLTYNNALGSQAGLFAAFLSAFLIELLGRLEEDPNEITRDILIHQTLMMRNTSLGPYEPSTFSPPGHIVAVNALFYASLTLMLLAAFIAMLIKNWVREFDRGLRGMSISEQRAKTREFRYQGLVHWKLSGMVAILPILIQLSLLLFFIGLALFLFQIDTLSSAIALAGLGIGSLFYAITTTISVVVTSSPFRSPLSRGLSALYRRFHAVICPHIDYFFSRGMDMTPMSFHSSLKKRFRLFLLKARPYTEEHFVEPFADNITDSINLNVSRKALEWLYRNVPTSRHSEKLHWAVWTAASSPAFRTPLFLPLPPWIMAQFRYAPSFLGDYPLSTCVAFATIFSRTDAPDRDLAQAVLDRLKIPASPWHELVRAMNKCVFEPEALHEIISLIRKGNLEMKELIWMLETLHWYCNNRLRWLGIARARGDLVVICRESLRSLIIDVEGLATPEGSLLADSAIMLAADALLPRPPLHDRQWQPLLLEREQPWTLPSLRSMVLITRIVDSSRSDEFGPALLPSAQQFFFLLFLYLVRRESRVLATSYLNIIARNHHTPLWAASLAIFASTMSQPEVILGARLWMAPLEDRATLIQTYNSGYAHSTERDHITDLFTTYDAQLRDTHALDPALLVALLSNGTPRYSFAAEWLNKKPLKHSWWYLTALTIVGNAIPDDRIPEVWNDYITLNLIASKQLQRIHAGSTRFSRVQRFPIVASFLQSQEFIIALLSLKYSFDMIRWIPPAADANNSTPAAPPPRYLPNSVRVIFNSNLARQRLLQSWAVMRSLMEEWGNIPVDWKCAIATAFWPRSHRPLPRLNYEPEDGALGNVLKRVITWDFVQAMQKEPEFAECNGLDWFVALWELGRAEEHEGEGEGGKPGENDQELKPWEVAVISGPLVLDAFCKLLSATQDVLIIPLLPRNFIQQVEHDSAVVLRDTTLARLDELCSLKYTRFSCTLRLD